MSAQDIYDSAPLGALIKFSDGQPRPPARFTKKVAAWRRSNGTGRLIRKTPPIIRGNYSASACFTLHEADFASGGVVVMVVHRTYGVDSDLHFEIAGAPKPSDWRVVQPYVDTVELLHLADNRAAAEAWLQTHRHPHARIEPAGGSGHDLSAVCLAVRVVTHSIREAV